MFCEQYNSILYDHDLTLRCQQTPSWNEGKASVTHSLIISTRNNHTNSPEIHLKSLTITTIQDKMLTSLGSWTLKFNFAKADSHNYSTLVINITQDSKFNSWSYVLRQLHSAQIAAYREEKSSSDEHMHTTQTRSYKVALFNDSLAT